MKLIPKAKPVRIRIFSGGEFHSSLDSLRSNFDTKCDLESLLELYKDGTLLRWLRQIGTEKEIEELTPIEVNDDSKIKIDECEKLLSIFSPNIADLAYKVAQNISNPKLKLHLYTISAERGNNSAKYQCALCEEKKNFSVAVRMYYENAQEGHVESILKIVEYYINGRIITKNLQNIIKILLDSNIEERQDYIEILKVISEYPNYEPTVKQISEICVKLNKISYLYFTLLNKDYRKPLTNRYVTAPISGEIVKINVSEAEKVSRNQELLIIKNANQKESVLSGIDGIVQKISINPEFYIPKGQLLLEISPLDSFNFLSTEEVLKQCSLLLQKYNITLSENLKSKGTSAIINKLTQIGIDSYNEDLKYYNLPTERTKDILKCAAKLGSSKALDLYNYFLKYN